MFWNETKLNGNSRCQKGTTVDVFNCRPALIYVVMWCPPGAIRWGQQKVERFDY